MLKVNFPFFKSVTFDNTIIKLVKCNFKTTRKNYF